MSAIVDATLEKINDLYSQIANLPEAVPSDSLIVSSLKQTVTSTLESLSAFKQWEGENQKKAKLIRESHVVDVQRNTMKTALKFVKRAMQEEINLHSSRPIFQCIAKLSQLARNISISCPPEELEMYLGEMEADKTITIMLYTNAFVVQITLCEQVNDSKASAGEHISGEEEAIGHVEVVCQTASLQHSRNGDMIGDIKEVDEQILVATNQFIKDIFNHKLTEISKENSEFGYKQSRLYSCLLSLTRSASASALLKGSNTTTAPTNSAEKGDSVKWIGPSTDIRQSLKLPLQQLEVVYAICPRTTVEGVELQLWPPPSLLETEIASSSQQLVRLSPAVWRRRSVVACTLSTPLVLHVSMVRQLLALALGYTLDGGQDVLSDDIMAELKSSGCFSSLGSRRHDDLFEGIVPERKEFHVISQVAPPLSSNTSQAIIGGYPCVEDVFGQSFMVLHWLPFVSHCIMNDASATAQFILVIHLLRTCSASSAIISTTILNQQVERGSNLASSVTMARDFSDFTSKMVSILPIYSPINKQFATTDLAPSLISDTCIAQQSILVTMLDFPSSGSSQQTSLLSPQQPCSLVRFLIHFNTPNGYTMQLPSVPSREKVPSSSDSTSMHVDVLQSGISVKVLESSGHSEEARRSMLSNISSSLSQHRGVMVCATPQSSNKRARDQPACQDDRDNENTQMKRSKK